MSYLLDTHIFLCFDRMLIAQANVEGLTLITDDAIIPQYAVKVL